MRSPVGRATLQSRQVKRRSHLNRHGLATLRDAGRYSALPTRLHVRYEEGAELAACNEALTGFLAVVVVSSGREGHLTEDGVTVHCDIT